MSILDFAIIAAVAVLFVLALRHVIRHPFSCGGNCANCAKCCAHKKNEEN